MVTRVTAKDVTIFIQMRRAPLLEEELVSLQIGKRQEGRATCYFMKGFMGGLKMGQSMLQNLSIF